MTSNCEAVIHLLKSFAAEDIRAATDLQPTGLNQTLIISRVKATDTMFKKQNIARPFSTDDKGVAKGLSKVLYCLFWRFWNPI